MADDRVTLLHEWFEQVWNRGDETAIHRLMAPDCVTHGLRDADGTPVTGKAAFLPFFTMFRTAFPDMQIVIEDSVVEGDKIAVRCTVRGTLVDNPRLRCHAAAGGVHRHVHRPGAQRAARRRVEQLRLRHDAGATAAGVRLGTEEPFMVNPVLRSLRLRQDCSPCAPPP